MTVDDHLGGRLVGEHLPAAGHRRIIYLAPDFQQTRAREAGLREALGDRARVDLVRCSAMTLEAGASAVDDLLPGDGAGPTAVFCGNDLIALGLLGECLRRGVQVPHDIAVVGYDDIELSAAASVPITTVRQPRRELGARAVELLINDGGPGGPGHEAFLLRPELVVRASSR